MNVFVAAMDAVLPHFRVRGHTLLLAQGHPFTQVAIDLRHVASHKLPSPLRLKVRLLRGRWRQFRLDGFRPAEIMKLRALLISYQRRNHQRLEG